MSQRYQKSRSKKLPPSFKQVLGGGKLHTLNSISASGLRASFDHWTPFKSINSLLCAGQLYGLPPVLKDDTKKRLCQNADRWLDEHGDSLYRYALVRVRVPDVAQDLVQDTFLAALRNYDTFAGKAAERTWLCGILKNKIVDYYRKRARETSFADLEWLSDELSQKFTDGSWVHVVGPKNWRPEADVVTYRAEFWETMHKCIGKLPRRVAAVFTLREMDELQTDAVCSMLQISQSNLAVMLHRARMAIRECLELNWFEKGKR